MCKIDLQYSGLPLLISRNNDYEPYHWHTNAQEIIWVLKGEAEVVFNNQSYPVNEYDDIILISDSDAHKVIKKSDQLDYISFHIDVPYFEKYITDITYVVIYCNPGYRNEQQLEKLPELRRLLAMILLEWKDKNKSSEQHIIDLLQKLLLILRNHFNYMGKTIIDYHEVEKFNRMYRICYYLYEHFEEKVSLSQLADYVHVNESYLSRNLKEITGLGFTDTLNFIRCEKGIRLLLGTEDTITKISYDCGFSDPKYFNHYFMTFFGCSPGEFRSQNKTDQWKYYSWRQQESFLFDSNLTAFLIGTLESDDEWKERKNVTGQDNAVTYHSLLLTREPGEKFTNVSEKLFRIEIIIEDIQWFTNAMLKDQANFTADVGRIADAALLNPVKRCPDQDILSYLHFCFDYGVEAGLILSKEQWNIIRSLSIYTFSSYEISKVKVFSTLQEYRQDSRKFEDLSEDDTINDSDIECTDVFLFLHEFLTQIVASAGSKKQNLTLKIPVKAAEDRFGLFSEFLIPKTIYSLLNVFSSVKGEISQFGDSYVITQDALGFFLIIWNESKTCRKKFAVSVIDEDDKKEDWLIHKYLIRIGRAISDEEMAGIWDMLTHLEKKELYNLHAPQHELQLIRSPKDTIQEVIPEKSVLFVRLKSLKFLHG